MQIYPSYLIISVILTIIISILLLIQATHTEENEKIGYTRIISITYLALIASTVIYAYLIYQEDTENLIIASPVLHILIIGFSISIILKYLIAKFSIKHIKQWTLPSFLEKLSKTQNPKKSLAQIVLSFSLLLIALAEFPAIYGLIQALQVLSNAK